MREYFRILKLVWPLALGMVNNAAMQFVDRAFLARESMFSLEAALPASILSFNILGFFHSIVAYSGTFVSQYHGAGDAKSCRACLKVASFLSLAFGAISFLFIPAGRMILEHLSSSPEVLSREIAYFDIIMAGGVFLFLQMGSSAYFTGLGKTRTVFWVNIAGNVFNAALDPVLIFGLFGIPRLGIAGAAYATVASTALQYLALALIARKTHCAAQDSEQKSGSATGLLPLAAKILRFGIPSGVYTFFNILSFTIFVFVTGRTGDLAFAVSNACFSVNYILFAPMEGFSLGAATLVGQAQGRKDSAAAERDAMRTLILGVGITAFLSLLAVLLCRPVLSLFVADAAIREEFLSLGFTLFILMAAWQVFDAADIIISGALKGAGDTKFVMWWMLSAAFGLWLPLVWAVAKFHNTMPALWATMVVYVVAICAGETIRWRRGAWRSIKLVD